MSMVGSDEMLKTTVDSFHAMGRELGAEWGRTAVK